MISQQDIPDHWELQTIEDVCSVNGNYTYPEDEFPDEEFNYISVSEVSGDSGQIADTQTLLGEEASTRARRKISSDDVLVSTVRPYLRAFALVPKELDGSIASTAFAVLTTGDKLRPEFLYQYVRSPVFTRQMEAKQKGANYPEVRLSDVKQASIPVPPLDEQERIVATVEERLNAVEKLEQSVEHVDKFSTEYEESLLAFLLAGKGDLSQGDINGLPSQEDIREGWKLKELGDVVEYHSNLVDPSKNPDKEYSLIELNDVEQNGRGLSNVQTKMGEDIGSNKREFNSDHILYCKLRPYLNKVVKPNFEGIASSELLVFEPGEDISREYLYQYLASPMVCNKAEFLMKGANHPRISKKELMEFNIPVPPKEQQEDVIQKMEMIQESELDKSLSNIRPLFEEYRESILTHAFRGEVEY